jgi:cleavage and polyadenylation specificity factor subunit 1
MSMQIDGADGVWSATVTNVKGALSNPNQVESSASRQYVVITRPTDAERESSEVYVVEGQELKPFTAPDFNPNEDQTVDIGPLADGTRVIQVLQNEVRSYDMGKFPTKSPGENGKANRLRRFGFVTNISRVG